MDRHWTVVRVAPGFTIVITPPYAHMHWQPWCSVGAGPLRAVGAPGTHGAGVTGVHVPGVRTPRAAAVCAAVIGFARLVHSPNGKMLANGLLSMMFAAGMFSIMTRFSGVTTSVLGARPKLHIVIAPLTTGRGTASTVVAGVWRARRARRPSTRG
jgi:hypothetical protein